VDPNASRGIVHAEAVSRGHEAEHAIEWHEDEPVITIRVPGVISRVTVDLDQKARASSSGFARGSEDGDFGCLNVPPTVVTRRSNEELDQNIPTLLAASPQDHPLVRTVDASKTSEDATRFPKHAGRNDQTASRAPDREWAGAGDSVKPAVHGSMPGLIERCRLMAESISESVAPWTPVATSRHPATPPQSPCGPPCSL
jgi:hypothetical protein